MLDAKTRQMTEISVDVWEGPVGVKQGRTESASCGYEVPRDRVEGRGRRSTRGHKENGRSTFADVR